MCRLYIVNNFFKLPYHKYFYQLNSIYLKMSSKKKKKASWSSNLDGSFTIESHSSPSPCNKSKYNSGTDIQSPKILPDGELTASVMQISNREVSNTLSQQLIELNPETMELCEMSIGSCALVYSHPNKMVPFRAWPNNNFPIGKVGLSSEQCRSINVDPDSFVKVKKISNAALAENIVLQLKITFNTNLEMLEKYVKKILYGRFIVFDQELQIEYFGKTLEFNISKINESSSNISSKHSESSWSVTKSLSNEKDINDSFCNLSISNDKENTVHELDKLKHKNLNSTFNISNETGPELNIHFNKNLPKVYQISQATHVQVIKHDLTKTTVNKAEVSPVKKVTFDAIGGLSNEIQQLKQRIILPLKNPQLYKSSGIMPSTGILVHGAPGTGKSMVVKALINEAGVNVVYIEATTLLSRYFGESEQKLVAIFEEANAKAPSIIVVEEIDVLCSKRDSSKNDAEKRIVSTFISLMDDLTNKPPSSFVFIVATTNRIDAVDLSLRRSGRFGCEIEIGVPSPSDRVEIFNKLLEMKNCNVTSEDIVHIANVAHGYVGADLSAVCHEASINALQRSLSSGDQKVEICLHDLEHGLKVVPPSAMREILVQVPKVNWSDIGGNENVRKKLCQAVEWPLKNPEAFERLGIEPPRGVLLYGPPGCSKTLHAKALATESGLNFISIKGPELLNKYVGESELAIRNLFRKARSVAPSIIFFDELDALASQRGSSNVNDRVLATLLTEMDGVEKTKDVIVVAATNRPDMIDKALLRPGRIDRIIHVPLPDDETKKEIFKIHFKKTPVDGDVEMEWLLKKTERFSGAEVTSVCREAAVHALDEDMSSEKVCQRHFNLALSEVKPQTTEQQIKLYEQYSNTLRSTIK